MTVQHFQHLSVILNNHIEESYSEFQNKPLNLYEPMSYILSMGGKRIRPLFALIGCDLFGKNPEVALPSALAVELFHNFSLIHDDIMDKAPLRRGKATVHEKWNSTIAILSGDAMLVKAYDFLSRNKSERLHEMLQLFNSTALQVCEGQQFDMDFESEKDLSIDAYIEMITLKTAVLIGCSLKLGALAADADQEQADLLYNYGKNTGIAFQLKDDILDVYGDSEKVGKQSGGDILSNKKTFLLLSALHRAVGRQKKELQKWISSLEFDPQEKVKEVRKIYDELDIRITAEQEAKKYFQLATEQLKKLKADENKKDNLLDFSVQLIEREF